MREREWQLTLVSEAQKQRATKLVRLSRERRPGGREQVAAVCYRIGKRGLEFLLVQTRTGRWTFPKGGAEPGLTYAQAAALEAFEEAGVHGRIEQLPFARYRRRPGSERTVKAHLCEVLRLGPPQESGRNPTWFPAGKAKRRLRQDRAPESAAELVAVVDRAVARIHRLQNAISTGSDTLQKVQFEASEKFTQMRQAWSRHFRDGDIEHSASLAFAVNAYLGKLLRFPPRNSNRAVMTLSGETRNQLLLPLPGGKSNSTARISTAAKRKSVP